jgi:hypothetical protein
MLGTPESEPLKVAALKLFHPTASPSFQRVGFLVLRHSLGIKLDEALSLKNDRFQDLDPDFERFTAKNLITGERFSFHREWKMNHQKLI